MNPATSNPSSPEPREKKKREKGPLFSFDFFVCALTFFSVHSGAAGRVLDCIIPNDRNFGFQPRHSPPTV